jgi:hypothetical protein
LRLNAIMYGSFLFHPDFKAAFRVVFFIKEKDCHPTVPVLTLLLKI